MVSHLTGTMYDASIGNDKYALQIAHVLEKHAKLPAKKQLSAPMWREIEFAQTMHELQPDHFTKLYDWKIAPYPNKYGLDKRQITNKDLSASTVCAMMLYERIDLTLYQLCISWKEFRDDIFQALLIQLIYVVSLMQKEKYVHNDLNPLNIGLRYTNKKWLVVNGQQVPTYGMLICIISGSILNEKYILSRSEREYLKYASDIFMIVNTLSFRYGGFSYFYKKELQDKSLNDFSISKADFCTLRLILGDTKHSKENEVWLVRILYRIIYYDKYERAILGKKLKQVIPPQYLMPMNMSLFIIANIYDIDAILKYLTREVCAKVAL